MRIDFTISQSELGKFQTSCEALIRNVGTGTKAATEYAGWDIMSDSLSQVPIDTGTLASSAFLGVSRRTNVSNYRYGAVLGYGDSVAMLSGLHMGGVEWLMAPTNNVNPKSGLLASSYAAKVHEDLDMPHPRGGKAKFLEDPVRNWASGKFARTAMYYWKNAIEYSNHFGTKTTWVDSATGKRYNDINWIRSRVMRQRMTREIMPEMRRTARINPYLSNKHSYDKKTGRAKPVMQRGGRTVRKGED